MQAGPFQFNPHWVATLVTVPLLVMLVLLGIWQLDRAVEKAFIVAQHVQLAARAPRAMATFENSQPLKHERISATGYFNTKQQFLVDNRTHKGVAGYHVLTPLLLSDGGVLMVNRGWVATGYDRARLPDIAIESSLLTLVGTAHFPATDQLLLGASGYETSAWPRVVQRLELETIGLALAQRVHPYTVRLHTPLADGLARDWPVHYGISAQRHNGYAFQWFSLALALLTIYLVVNTRRSKKS